MAHRFSAGEVLLGTKTPVWGCSCGESANWTSRLKCKTCWRAAPQKVADKATAASKQVQAAPPEPTERRPAAESKELWQVKQRLRKVELSASTNARGAFDNKRADTRMRALSAPRERSQSRERGRPQSRRATPAGAPQSGDYVVVSKKRRRKSVAAQVQVLQRQVAESKRLLADTEKRAKAAAATATPAAGPADISMAEESAGASATGWQ